MVQWKGMITSDPSIMMGKPAVACTRITVEHVLEKMAHGEAVGQILEEHPQLTEDTVRAALVFAAETMRATVIRPVPEVAD